MQIKISKKFIRVFLVVIVGVALIALFGRKNPTPEIINVKGQSVAVIQVKAGYYPQELVLQANKENVLRFVTKNTYDCSASLLIAKLQIEKFLPPTGSTDIIIPAQEPGTEIVAGCSMGMYNFKLKFL